MRIARLEATEVHGYLPIQIDFLPDLTFLTGLNGSGKTTALRLLMGLLAPSLEELIDIKFGIATVVVNVNGKEVSIKATKSTEELALSISTQKVPITVKSADFQLIAESRNREEPRASIYMRLAANPVFRAIRDLSTPMFLGLDRRLHLDERDIDPQLRMRRIETDIRHRSALSTEVSIKRVTEAILSDVNELVSGALSEVRAKQERLDEDLRNKILLDSFRYESTDVKASTFPNRATVNKFRARQEAIEKAAAGLRLPAGQLQASLREFLERMTKTLDAVEEEEQKMRASRKTKPSKTSRAPTPAPPYIIEWLMNSRQADRIFKQIELLDEYVTNRATLHQPIDRFLALANDFLKQTGKRLKVSPRGNLRVNINDAENDHPLFALSSGERQLVVMLAHLSLNKRLAESGIFIVDEPELSLHISWQEQFVDAIQKANPNVQLILATHSPAIILERTDRCRSLSQAYAS
jgi:predicted ATP-binding protein involved in virulence